MTKRIWAAVLAGATAVGGLVPLAGGNARGAALNVRQVWSVPIADGSNPIAQSSPTVATLDSGGQAAVVGDRAGNIYALHISDGSEAAGWPTSTGGIPIDSALSSSGSVIFAGEGFRNNANAGGLAAYNDTGKRIWFHPIPSAPGSAQTVGVDSSAAVGNLQGQVDIVSGSMGQFADAVVGSTGNNLSGWPWFQADTNFTTPAIADLYSNGTNEVVMGGDSTAGNAEGQQYSNGGHLRVISPKGNLSCVFNTNQVVQSSPAVGEFLAGGAVGIVSGTGFFQSYSGASDTNKVLGLNTHCGLVWSTVLDGVTNSSPALVDALGNGSLDVAEPTNSNNLANGSVYLLNGTNGQVIWHTTALGGILGGVVSADLGGGYQDLVAATTKGVEILDGKTGAVLWTGLTSTGFQNAPLITEDANGQVGITVAGYNNTGSVVVHLEVAGSSGSVVNEAGAWPMFHHDPQLTGDAGTPPPTPPAPCKAPAGGPDGYWLSASDGGVFTFGNLPYCGSTGGIALNAPVVGMAGTPNGGGYWLVASDGGIFTFGNAAYHGSTGGIRLSKPIVGMARTPDGGGYWLVASDGGIFSFGDAHFHGSTGGIRLAKPVVGMASTPDGNGYWLDASDGGIFTFGDATFHGSTGGKPLAKPVIGMNATPSGNGYWLYASDGGIFTFGDATFHGSTGGIALVKPIVSMAGY